jgi:type II secretory pathway predicted ATPase ExeA
MADEVFPAGPDRVERYPAVAQQRVLAALQQDVAAGRHLLCMTGPPGSGKTVLLRALRQSLQQGLVGLIEKPTPGRLLVDVARSLHVNAVDDNESILRRQLVMMLSMADQQHKPIIQIVDDADSLSTDDLDLLVHFFPSGHATIILAGAADPEAWLADCMTSSGSVHFDQIYRLEPFSVDETAAYIRHRLREAGRPEDLLPPGAVAAIHQQSGGLPGAIHLRGAELLAQAGAQGRASIAAPESTSVFQSAPAFESAPIVEATSAPSPAPAPAFESDRKAAKSIPDPADTDDVRIVPERIPGGRKVSAPRSRPAPPGIGPGSGIVTGPSRRLKRRVRFWRTTAILAGTALAVVLTQEVWIDRVPLDRTWLAGIYHRVLDRPVPESPVRESNPFTAPEDHATPAASEARDDADDGSDFAALEPPSPAAGTVDAPPTETPATPAPALESAPGPSPASSADSPVNPVSPTPQDRGEAAQAATEVPETTAPESAAPGTTESGTEAPGAAAPETEATESAAPEMEAPPLTPAQRAEIGRLYAVRAEYEWSKGDLESASVSIRNGLSSDPGNPVLLEMRARLREAMRVR